MLREKISKISCLAVEKYANMLNINFVCKVPSPHSVRQRKSGRGVGLLIYFYIV